MNSTSVTLPSRSTPLVRPLLGRTSPLLLLLLATCLAFAFPPAPHHLIYGTVRDDMGHPLMVTNSEVVLETLSGVRLQTRVVPNLGPGLNYRLSIPIDAGLTADPYKPTALRPTLPFRLKVLIAGVTYLPLELGGNTLNLGQPAQTTRLDLTLGVDSDRDGLPDAWEQTLLTGDMTLSDIRPDNDEDNDGLTNLQEYLAGTYAFDPDDGLKLDIVHDQTGRRLIQFLAIAGRNYTVHGSSDVQNWRSLPFRLAGDSAEIPARTSYQARDVRTVVLEVLNDKENVPAQLFLRAQVE
jgi:hypothetical protein